MTGDAASELRVVERAGPARRVVLRADGGGRSNLWVLAGYDGPDLPDVAVDARIERLEDGRYRLGTAQGTREFRARAVDCIALRPEYLDKLHRPFALRRRERIAARALLTLLRLPVGARLLRAWHARRAS